MKFKLYKVKNLILLACSILALTVLLGFWYSRPAFAEEVLDTVDYLDFELNSPRAIYGDEEIIAVSCESELVFFYNGKIYRKDISAAGQLLRNGNKIYYTKNSLLFSVEIGSFTESAVSDADGTPIAANSFAISGDRLIALTNSGGIYYDSFKKVSPAYDFSEYDNITNQQIAAGNVHIVGDDYYNINGEMFKNNVSLCFDVVDYFTHVGDKIYFSNKKGIFLLDGENTSSVYEREVKIRNEGVLGICGFGDNLLFIDGKTSKIMLFDIAAGTAEEYLFDITITTDAELTFTPTPVTVTASEGARVHTGSFSGGAFTYTSTKLFDRSFDLIKFGSVDKYAAVYGLDGFALIAEEFLTVKEQNTPITFEKGYILHDCTAYITCAATDFTASFTLNKSSSVTVISTYIMNGVEYYLIDLDGEKGFVPAGEVKESLLPDYPTATPNKTVVEGRDNTLVAIIIMLLSAGVFILTLFVILIKKEYFKL